MKNNNPVLIPRNHRVEEALLAAEKGNFTTMKNLLQALENPYEYKPIQRQADSEIIEAIIQIFESNRSNYGTRKIKVELKKQGHLHRSLVFTFTI